LKDNADPLIPIVIFVLMAFIVLLGGERNVPNQPTPAPTGIELIEPSVTPTVQLQSSPTSTVAPSQTSTATPSSTPTPTREPRDDDWVLEIKPVGHHIDCDDKEVLNGYYFPDQGGWGNDFCVPGMITRDSQFYNPPDHF
jgi:hypothetical protein